VSLLFLLKELRESEARLVLSISIDSEVSGDLLLLQLNNNRTEEITNNFFIITFFMVNQSYIVIKETFYDLSHRS